jgi:hypothetical protein
MSVVYHKGMIFHKPIDKYGADLIVELENGSNGVVALEVKLICPPSHPTGITTSMLRAITASDLDGITASLKPKALTRGFTPKGELSWRPGSRTPLDKVQLELVARTYIDALKAGLPPTKTIQQWANASRPTASRWIKEARELGLIGQPTKHGLPGNNPRKGNKT